MQKFFEGLARSIHAGMRRRGAALIALSALTGAGIAGAQTIPAAVASSSQAVLNLSVSYGGGVAVNTLGDVFYVDPGTNDAYELTPGSSTPIVLLTGLSGSRSVSVDHSNNVYVADTYNATIIEIPFSGGTYATNTAAGGLSASNNACPAAPKSPCVQFSGAGAAVGYYFQATDVGFDAKGDAFVIAQYLGGGICDGTGGVHCNAIVEFAAPITSSTTGTIVGGGPGKLPNQASAQLAVDPLGDVFYADGTTLYEVPAGTTTATPVAGTYNSPGGVGVDAFGNFFVSDTGNNRIVEIPTLAGVPQPAKAFTLSYTYSSNSVGVDTLGRLYYLGYNNTLGVAALNQLTVWNANFGTAALGTATTPITLGLVFNSAAAITNIGISKASNSGFSLAATQPSGACTAQPYAVGGNCSLTVNYTPTAVGLQRGALVLATATGAPVATAYLAGTGVGAAQTVDPGTVTAIGAGWKAPAGIAVDGAGNVYVSDTKANTVSEYAAGATTPTSVGTGLNGPTGVAVDGAGNVFIGDSGNSRVVEVQNGAQSVVYTGGSSTIGLAIDYTGSLIIADSGKQDVVRLTNTDGSPNAGYTSTIGSQFSAPDAVVADALGNVFVADQTKNTVTEVSLLSGTQTGVGSGFSHPSGLALDASGSVYIADPGNQRLVKIPLENGGFNANDAYSVGSSVVTPYGVAIDSAFNLYAVDNANANVVQILRTQGTLALGRANLNNPTSQLNANIGDAGNQALVFKTPDYTATGSTTQFSVTSPSTNGCANGGTVGTGFACLLAASFDPTTTGSFTETLAFASNAGNTAAPQLLLTGTGLNLAKTTTVLTASTLTPALGQSVSATATISSAVAGTPTGFVQFYVNSVAYLQGGVTNGAATVMLTNLNGGQQTISASYLGDNNYAPSAATPIIITVAKGTTSTTLVVTSGFNNPQSSTPGYNNTLTATVSASGAQSPTNSVSFYSGTTLLGSSPVASGVAVLATTAIPTGNDVITAVYNGDVNYNGSTSAGVPLIVATPGFTLTPANASLTLTSGQTGTVLYTVTPISGYTPGAIELVCSGLPADAVCSFSPNSFPFNGPPAAPPMPQTVTGLILTGQTPIIGQPPLTGSLRGHGARAVPWSLALLLLAPFGLLGRRSTRKGVKKAGTITLAMLFFCVAVTGFTGCGSSLFGNTPKGNYTVTVTAYGGAQGTTTLTQTATISLTVQ